MTERINPHFNIELYGPYAERVALSLEYESRCSWQYADAKGYPSLFVSSQTYAWYPTKAEQYARQCAEAYAKERAELVKSVEQRKLRASASSFKPAFHYSSY